MDISKSIDDAKETFRKTHKWADQAMEVTGCLPADFMKTYRQKYNLKFKDVCNIESQEKAQKIAYLNKERFLERKYMTVDPLSDPFRKNKLKHKKTKSFNFGGYESKRSSVLDTIPVHIER